MHDKEDHAVFADEVNQRHSGRWQREQDARNAQQRKGYNEEYIPEGTCPVVRFHLILGMKEDVGKNEANKKQNADEEGLMFCQSIENLVPYLSQIEEENATKDIIQIEPQRVSMQEQPITDSRKEQYNPMQITYPFDEMHQNIGCKERKQEPQRTVAKGKTVY